MNLAPSLISTMEFESVLMLACIHKTPADDECIRIDVLTITITKV